MMTDFLTLGKYWMRTILLFTIILVISWPNTVIGQDVVKTDTTASKASVTYGSKGWKLNYGENYELNMEFRLQFRYTLLDGAEPDYFVPEEDNFSRSFNVQRARLKVGGHAYKPFLKYYLEYDFPSNFLLNWQLEVTYWDQLRLKVGQWKVEYNTERYVSSGKQQLTDRSIANRFFTFDRQVGIAILGDLFKDKVFCSSYTLGAFNGTGRGGTNENNHIMYMIRYQWNFSRSVIKKSFSDIERMSKPKGFLAISGVRNQSAYTSFASAGGGDLPGYLPGSKSQYLVHQLGLEYMLKFKGLSMMMELHGKQIEDLVNLDVSRLYGGYAMMGYFFNELIPAIPKSLEIFARYARVNHQDRFSDDLGEASFGVNYFFKGHRNKLTTDVAFLENVNFEADNDDIRFRIQWDISF